MRICSWRGAQQSAACVTLNEFTLYDSAASCSSRSHFEHNDAAAPPPRDSNCSRCAAAAGACTAVHGSRELGCISEQDGIVRGLITEKWLNKHLNESLSTDGDDPSWPSVLLPLHHKLKKQFRQGGGGAHRGRGACASAAAPAVSQCHQRVRAASGDANSWRVRWQRQQLGLRHHFFPLDPQLHAAVEPPAPHAPLIVQTQRVEASQRYLHYSHTV